MSDIDKVFARANQLGATTPIQLRWEGAGDCVHVRKVLIGIQNRTYSGTTTPIQYFATVNIYESDEHPIYAKAEENLALTAINAHDGQGCKLWYDADVTRNSRLAVAQPLAHIMFVRNIMLTNDANESLTQASGDLLNLHKLAVRQRANSLTDDGQLGIGMSGAPGLKSMSPKERRFSEIQTVFNGFGELQQAATESGLSLIGGANRPAKDDADKGIVMKNDGSSLGKKTTYYMTYMK